MSGACGGRVTNLRRPAQELWPKVKRRLANHTRSRKPADLLKPGEKPGWQAADLMPPARRRQLASMTDDVLSDGGWPH